MPKRLLSPEEKLVAAERLKAKALAFCPDAQQVTAYIDDETDEDGNPVGSAVTVRRMTPPQDRKTH